MLLFTSSRKDRIEIYFNNLTNATHSIVNYLGMNNFKCYNEYIVNFRKRLKIV